MARIGYEKSVETEIIELGKADDMEEAGHTLMAQTGHLWPDGRFLLWQEIESLNARTIEIKRAFIVIPHRFRALFSTVRMWQPSMAQA